MLTKLLAGLMALAMVFSGVQTYRLKLSKDQVASLELKSEAAEKEYIQGLLEQERVTTQRIADLTSKHLATQQEANKQYEDVLDDLHTTRLRLRERFVCPQPNPGAAPDSSGGATEAPTGLLEEDVRFFVSEAKRADDVVRQLTTTQELLEIYKRHYDELRARQK